MFGDPVAIAKRRWLAEDEQECEHGVGKDLRDAALAGLAIGALDALLGDDSASSPPASQDPYPDPPDESDLLEQAFRGFGQNLPQR